MSDEDSADEIDEDCKLLNGDVSEEGDLLPRWEATALKGQLMA